MLVHGALEDLGAPPRYRVTCGGFPPMRGSILIHPARANLAEMWNPEEWQTLQDPCGDERNQYSASRERAGGRKWDEHND